MGGLAASHIVIRFNNVRTCNVLEEVDECYLITLSKKKPQKLAGGLKPGNLVHYTGPTRKLPGTNITLTRGERGEVVGPQQMASRGDWSQAADRVAVRFDSRPGGVESVDCYASALNDEGPPPDPRSLPGAAGDAFRRTGAASIMAGGLSA